MAIGTWIKLLGSVTALGLLPACASTGGDPSLKAWRMVNQADKRFAVFVSEPGVREEALATFRMRFVYMPGEVKHEGRDVAWQEYPAMTVDCAKNTVRVGMRTRYAPDGAEIMSDDNQTFSEILVGTAADDAAKAKCKGVLWVGDVVFPEGPGRRLDHFAHLVLAGKPDRPARIGHSLEYHIVGAAFEHSIDVVGIVPVDIASNEGGNVGHPDS